MRGVLTMEDDAMRVARPVQLSSEQRKSLEQQSRARSQSARGVERARIVLRAADELEDKEIAAEFGITPEKAARWRNRFLDGGLAALQKDAPRPGRSRTITEARVKQVVDMTTRQKPDNATHWSTRTMAAAAGVSAASVRRIWHAHGLKPHLVRRFKVSNDPHFADKLETSVGLYLNPPEQAIVLCADEKSQIQALDRTQPGLPLKKGRCGTMTHDYKRNGTTTLFAALVMAEGRLIGKCMPRHRHKEWIKFLKLIDQETPEDLDLHLIVDNYSTHKHANVKAWLKRHPRFHVHFIPTASSWLNLVERWFREITDKRIRRGVFQSVKQLVAAIDAYIGEHNDNPRSFVWTAKAETILAKVRRARAVLDKMRTA